MDELQIRLFELVLRFNRRLTFIVNQLAPPLTLNESHVLGEIGRRRLITAAEIGRNLVLEKSIVSRLLAALGKRGLVSSESSPADGRLKHLKLTPAGEKIFEEDDNLRSEQVRRCVAALSSYEQSDLAYFLAVMADSLHASDVPLTQSDSSLKIQIRRLTRAMGFLGDNLLGTGLSVQKCQLLSILNSGAGICSMSMLREELPYESSMLSRLVSFLQAARLVIKDSIAGDLRRLGVKPTSAGRRFWSEKSRLAGNFIVQTLSGETPERMSHFASLLEKFLQGRRLFDGVFGENGIAIRVLAGEEQIMNGRAFLVQELVRRGEHNRLPEMLLSRRNFCVGVYRNDELKGLLECGKLKDRWQVFNFALAEDAAADKLLQRLIAGVFDILARRRVADQIYVPGLCPLTSRLADYPDKTRVEDGWLIRASCLRDSR